MKIDESMKLDSQLCFPLYAAARKITGIYTPYLKPFGITYTQYVVLLALWESGEASVGELCSRLYLDNGTMTPLLKKMDKAGWISRSRSEMRSSFSSISSRSMALSLMTAERFVLTAVVMSGRKELCSDFVMPA